VTSGTHVDRDGAFTPERPLEWPEVLFIAAFIPLAAFSWVGMLLAELGAFNGWRVAAAGSVLTALALTAALRDMYGSAGGIRRVSRVAWVSLGLVAAISTTVLSRPGEYLIEGADASVYLAIGHNIKRTGGITATDSVVSLMPQELRPTFFRVGRGIMQHEGRFAGGLRLGDDDRVNPGFFHLLPVWIAMGLSAAGPTAGYSVNLIPGVFGVIAVFLIGRRLWSPSAGLVAAVLLALNFGQIYFGRLAASEMLAQFMVLAAILFTVIASDLRSRVAGACAGAAIGLAAFSRVDALLLLVPLAGLWLLLTWRSQRLGGAWSWYAAFLAFVAGHAVLHAETVARLYSRRLFDDGVALVGRNLVAVNAVWAVAGIVALLAIAAAILTLRRRRFFWPTLCVGVAAITLVVAIVVAPPLVPMVNRLISPVGAAAALVGLLLLSKRADARPLPLIVPLVAQAGLLLAFHQATTLPDDFRRAVPILLPGAMLLIGFLVSQVARRGTWATLVIGLLPLGLATGFLSDAGPILRMPPMQGTHAQLAELGARIPPDALVLSDTSVPGHMALALNYTFDRPSVRMILRPTGGDGIAPLVSAALAGGRQVFVAVAPMIEQRPLWFWRSDFAGFDIQQAHEVTLRYDVLARTRGEFPRQLRTDTPTVVLYRVRALDFQTQVTLPLTVDVGVDDFRSLVDGFHAPEPFHATRARWTTGDSRIALPRLAASASGRMALVLRFAADRPPGHAPVEMHLTIGGIPVGAITVATIELREYRVPLSPAVMKRLLAGPSILSIVSDVFVPKDIIGGTDDRRLGVMLDWVRVE